MRIYIILILTSFFSLHLKGQKTHLVYDSTYNCAIDFITVNGSTWGLLYNEDRGIISLSELINEKWEEKQIFNSRSYLSDQFQTRFVASHDEFGFYVILDISTDDSYWTILKFNDFGVKVWESKPFVNSQFGYHEILNGVHIEKDLVLFGSTGSNSPEHPMIYFLDASTGAVVDFYYDSIYYEEAYFLGSFMDQNQTILFKYQYSDFNDEYLTDLISLEKPFNNIIHRFDNLAAFDMKKRNGINFLFGVKLEDFTGEIKVFYENDIGFDKELEIGLLGHYHFDGHFIDDQLLIISNELRSPNGSKDKISMLFTVFDSNYNFVKSYPLEEDSNNRFVYYNSHIINDSLAFCGRMYQEDSGKSIAIMGYLDLSNFTKTKDQESLSHKLLINEGIVSFDNFLIINQVNLYDYSGKLVKSDKVNSLEYIIPQNAPINCLIEVMTDQGRAMKKIFN